MPAKAQKAILATAFRDYDSPNTERMLGEIQNSIRAFYALLQSKDFVRSKTFKDARMAVEDWKIQYQIDDVTGESYLPAENFSNFALLLATMYKGENQSVIQGTFNKLYDLIQGTQEPNLFEQPDNTPRSLAQAIYETLNITYDGQQRSNVLVGDNSASQRGQQRSTGDAATRERIKSGERTADSAGSIEGDSRGIRIKQENRGNQGEETHIPQTEEVDEYGNHFVMASDGTSNFGVIDAESGLKQAPIKLSMGDNTIDENGENHGYGLLHIEASRGESIRNAGYASVQEFVESVAKNYTDIREGGIIANNQTYLLELVDEHNNTLFIQLSKNGEYWTINSAGIFRKKYSRNKRKVYDRPAIGSDTNTDISGVDSGHIDGVTTPAGNSPQTSESKGTTNSPNSNELEEKNVHSTIGEQVQAADSAGSIEGDNRGIRIKQENRGNQGEEAHIPQTGEIIGRSLSADEAENFIANMEENADTAPDIELTIENWDALFGEKGIVATPIGDVKMGENQCTKLMRADRNGNLGMIKPTLEHPHAIVEDTSEAKGDNVTERASSYVFIRSFKKADSSRYYYFTSVTVSKK